MKEELNFSAQQLLIDGDFPGPNDFQSFENEFKHIKDNVKDSIYYSIRTVLEKDYFWLAANFGKPSPRPDNVLDIKDFSFTSNPRKDTQVEQDEQLFVLYDFIHDVMYISNIK